MDEEKTDLAYRQYTHRRSVAGETGRWANYERTSQGEEDDETDNYDINTSKHTAIEDGSTNTATSVI